MRRNTAPAANYRINDNPNISPNICVFLICSNLLPVQSMRCFITPFISCLWYQTR